MLSHRRLSTVLALAASACALGAPAAHAGAPADGRGTVLSLGGHTVRLVDKAHRVGDVRVSSTRGLRRGDVVRVRRGRARVSGHARRLSFLGRVVRSSGRAAVVRLGDGSTFKLAGGHGLGETLLITIATGRRGDAVVAVKSLQGRTKAGDEGDRGAPRDEEACDDDETSADDAACGDDPGGDDDWVDEADGTVTTLAQDCSSLTIALDGDGGEETYPVADSSLLDEIAVGDEVAVYLDEDGTAVDVEPLDWSEDPGPGDDDGEDE